MSDLMTDAVINMPYEMAMVSELSRFQFYKRAQSVLQELRKSQTSYRLFIDDERFPTTPDWYVARTSNDAQLAIVNFGMPREISFDFDLGTSGDVRDFIKWLTNEISCGKLEFPEGFKYYVHSQNPVGAEWVRNYMNALIRHYGDFEDD